MLAKHLDGYLEETDCIKTNSILCDWCEQSLQPEDTSSSGSSSQDDSGAKAIYQALRLEVQQDKQLEQFYQLLYAYCIYCQLMRPEGEEESYCYSDCLHAASQGYDVKAY